MPTTAKIIADTLNGPARITTFEVYFPRIILAELNTHRVLSRSAASSRAIPVVKRIEMVRTDPYAPIFTRNRKGMSADEMLGDEEMILATGSWARSMEQALESAQELASVEAHKQQANRLLEPFSYTAAVVTGTEWDNFWHLRASVKAQPEFEELARAMQSAFLNSTPRRHSYHMPYIRSEEEGNPRLHQHDLFSISAARCARVSYTTVDGKVSTLESDLRLCADLERDGHLSPFDHPAIADEFSDYGSGRKLWCKPEDHRQFWGWIPYRVKVERRLGLSCRRDSYAPFDFQE